MKIPKEKLEEIAKATGCALATVKKWSSKGIPQKHQETVIRILGKKERPEEPERPKEKMRTVVVQVGSRKHKIEYEASDLEQRLVDLAKKYSISTFVLTLPSSEVPITVNQIVKENLQEVVMKKYYKAG